MTVRVYYHTDVGAPTLSGSAGSLIALLDACLVTGYGGKQAAGWIKAFTGTNVAAYKFNTPGVGDYFMYIDDAGTAPDARYARIFGYENMTSISDFTSQAMPTAAQQSGGGYIFKSDTINTAMRSWVVIATETAFYLYCGYASTDVSLASAGAFYRPMYFMGRIPSYKPGDAYNVALICHYSTSASANQIASLNSSGGQSGQWLARSYLQTGSSMPFTKNSEFSGSNVSAAGGYSPAWPDPVTGGFILSAVNVYEHPLWNRRGRMPGMWAICHNNTNIAGYNCGDTFDGTGALSGKTFLILNACGGGSHGRLAIEISNTW